ncbi:target of Myb protein 1-like isoform X2 [Brienomyrus brachyistius]|uniref:target of Myb protein 1-like isoform X2 n=1 Tax=Brienomyrus brachyistius TaxID=42636 RepID=UPI0020B36BCE|nr:target of Myb protein 1-like isoform X2 [Brienomyrus brachyistius]
MDFLIGSPFTTPVGQRIEHATSAALLSEDWGLNMEICDIINDTEDGPKDAVRAIKKRIVGNKNFREVMLALTVLETCVKNCGHRFHVLVSTREFVDGVLVRAILPRNNPPMVVQDRVLSLIQAWADAFRSSPSLTGVVSVYEDLRRRGVEFPGTELDGLSLIHTPRRSLPCSSALVSPPAVASDTPSAPVSVQDAISPPNSEVEKLRVELDTVRGNLTLMSALMSQLEPDRARPADMELLQQLYSVCKRMQDRVVQLIPVVSEESLMEELLKANDELNATFVSYNRFMKHCNGQNTTEQASDTTYGNLFELSTTPCAFNKSAAPIAPAHQPASQSTVSMLPSLLAGLNTREDDLSLSAQGNHNSQLSEKRDIPRVEKLLTEAPETRLQNNGEDVNVESAILGSSPNFDWMVAKGMIPVSQTDAMEDIEKWLDVDMEGELTEGEGVTSEEFDRFLEERAKAAEHLPSLGAPVPDPPPPQSHDFML